MLSKVQANMNTPTSAKEKHQTLRPATRNQGKTTKMANALADALSYRDKSAHVLTTPGVNAADQDAWDQIRLY